MPGIGSTGLYIDDKDNHYAARVVGRSFVLDEKTKSPAIGTDGKPQYTGNFEVMCTFRDGTEKLISQVPPSQLFEPDTTTPAP